MLNKVDFLAPKLGLRTDSPMYYWAKGINAYFRTWVDSDKKYGSTQETEDYLLRAIFTAAGESEDKVGMYKGYSTELKERYLQTKIMKNLENQTSENKLIAAWASTWLVNNYWELQNVDLNKYEPLKKIIQQNLELPLRKYFIIRTPKGNPPHYLNSYI